MWQRERLSKRIELAHNLIGMYSDYMKSFVDKKLGYLGCSPIKVEADSQKICYFCSKYTPCFGYKQVRRNGRVEINPYGRPTIDFKKYDVKVADFLSDGLASKLGCIYCDSFIIVPSKENDRAMILPKDSFIEASIEICNRLGYRKKQIRCEKNVCECGKFLLTYDGREIYYGQKM